ncbi:unnamed protein product [Cylicostephanus goldi]|uniref:Uncharacterized protein n=1 Tax=Cylicostephanus goldi TaxID=71465 RepID=A0A3P6RPF1_CYLGO|nr:unnamed protein product [Cylicostephanus goldi]
MTSSLQKVVGSLNCSRHAIDTRFHGGAIEEDNIAKVIQRFVTTTVSQWFSRELQLIPLSQQSAEHLSRTLSKYEISNTEVNFVNLPIISNAVDAIIEALSKPLADEDEIFMVCLRLLLFVVAARKPLDARTGCAFLYIAWEQVQRVMLKHGCAPLLKIAQQMNKGWSLDAYQRFINDYLPLYEKHRLVNPFTSEEECQKFTSTINIKASDGMDVDKIVPPTDDEEIVFTQKPSPIASALHLSVLMKKLHAFFATGAFDSVRVWSFSPSKQAF